MTYGYEDPAIARAAVGIEAAIQDRLPLPACPVCSQPTDGVEVERRLHELAHYTLTPCGHVVEIVIRLERR